MLSLRQFLRDCWLLLTVWTDDAVYDLDELDTSPEALLALTRHPRSSVRDTAISRLVDRATRPDKVLDRLLSLLEHDRAPRVRAHCFALVLVVLRRNPNVDLCRRAVPSLVRYNRKPTGLSRYGVINILRDDSCLMPLIAATGAEQARELCEVMEEYSRDPELLTPESQGAARTIAGLLRGAGTPRTAWTAEEVMKVRLAVVVNLEWEGVLGDYLYYVLQTNGVSVDGTEVRYVDNAPDSLSRDMTAEHRSLADSAAGADASMFLKLIKTISPTGMHARIYVYGDSLR